MRYDDFCRCTLEEFEAVCNAWQSREDAAYRDSWERMRMQSYISIQPHVQQRLTPQALLPFSWDAKPERKKISKEERASAMHRAIEKYGDTL